MEHCACLLSLSLSLSSTFASFSRLLSLSRSRSFSFFLSPTLPLSFSLSPHLTVCLFLEDRVFAFIPTDRVPAAAVSSLLLLPSSFSLRHKVEVLNRRVNVKPHCRIPSTLHHLSFLGNVPPIGGGGAY